jgi:hypothetical protein
MFWCEEEFGIGGMEGGKKEIGVGKGNSAVEKKTFLSWELKRVRLAASKIVGVTKEEL